jgi:hypothetical protein
MLTTVGRYFDPWEAHILRARLEAEGIPASVAGDQHIIANWPLSVALGGAALQVPTPYLAQAREILAAYQAGTFEQDLIAQDAAAADNCPSCGSTTLHRSIPLKQRALVLATFLLASAPFPTRESQIQCRSCRHRWTYGG